MQGFLRAGLVLICLMLVLVQDVSAFNVTHISVEPSGLVTPGTGFSINGKIGFIPSSDETFKSSHSLQFSTDLENAKWSWILVLDGDYTHQPSTRGNSSALYGGVLSYPKSVNESLKFKLEGTAPKVGQITNKTLIRIQEADKRGIPVPGTTREYFVEVVNIREMNNCGTVQFDDLKEFRSHIDEMATLGINTTLAEVKYSDANKQFETAQVISSLRNQEALINLESARNDIVEGERLLDKAWAEKEVADAVGCVENVDSIIAQLASCNSPNSCGKDSPQWRMVLTERETAVQYINTSNNLIAAGNYSAARESAGIALAHGNDSYTVAQTFQKTMSRTTPGVPLSPVCSGVALVIAGFVVARFSRKSWEDPE